MRRALRPATRSRWFRRPGIRATAESGRSRRRADAAAVWAARESHDRSRQVRRALDGITGQKQSLPGQFNLSTSEIIDITAETGGLGAPGSASAQAAAAAANAARGAPVPITSETDTLQRVQNRECRRAGDMGCMEAIVSEAAALAQYLEERVTQSLNGLGSLLDALRDLPGRKTVVVLSGGMAVSDRPGGRVDIGNEAKQLGGQAAHANATIYALHVDTGLSKSYSAQSRRARTPCPSSVNAGSRAGCSTNSPAHRAARSCPCSLAAATSPSIAFYGRRPRTICWASSRPTWTAMAAPIGCR